MFRLRKRLQAFLAAQVSERCTLIFSMLLKTLREEVLEANLELVRRGLVLYTFGNVSGMDRSEGLVAIKPSGVPYEELTAAHQFQVRFQHLFAQCLQQHWGGNEASATLKIKRAEAFS